VLSLPAGKGFEESRPTEEARELELYLIMMIEDLFCLGVTKKSLFLWLRFANSVATLSYF
jgi:hypothetical protein